MHSLSPLSITALAEVIAGEARNINNSSLLGGKIRSARQIQQFMMEFGVDFSDPWSKVKDLRKCLENLPRETLLKIADGAFSKHSFEKHYVSEASVDYVNRFLKEDGFEVKYANGEGRISVLENLEPKESIKDTQPDSSQEKSFFEGLFNFFVPFVLIPVALIWLGFKGLVILIFKVLSAVVGSALKHLVWLVGLFIAVAIVLIFVYPYLPKPIGDFILQLLNLRGFYEA